MADLDIEVDATKGYIFAMFFVNLQISMGRLLADALAEKLEKWAKVGIFLREIFEKMSIKNRFVW